MNYNLSHGELTADLMVSESMRDLDVEFSKRQEGDLVYLDIELNSTVVQKFQEIQLQLKLPFVDMHSCWTPGIVGNPISIRNKGICEWRYGFESKVSKLAPVACLYSIDNHNRLAVALSDATESVVFHVGAYEEERVALVLLKFFSEEQPPRQQYRVSLRLDMRPHAYYRAIQDMASWYEEDRYPHMPVPESASLAVYSTWYAFHKNLQQEEVLRQCAAAKELGCDLLILDDGWQAGDSDRDYKYCGDWQVDQERFVNMCDLVDQLHNTIGMKAMLWMSVPFVGRCSQIWSDFKEQILFYSEKNDAGVFDPRYPSVRQHIANTCQRLLAEYDFDGLKLDFIDEFDMARAEGKALLPDPLRDTESLQQAVEMLLAEIRFSLQALKEDVLIEFRQSYVGPAVRHYGNILRVHDCPNDAIMNRMSIVDLRLFSGETAVHSDMIIWSPQDSVESVSLHFINTLFAVPQISPNVDQLSQQHKQVVKHWLNFWQRHKALLLQGELTAINPEMQYPIISSRLGDEMLSAVFAEIPVKVFDAGEKFLYLVNGSMKPRVIVETTQARSVRVQCFDCKGQFQSEQELLLDAGLNEVSLAISGYATMSILNKA